MTKKKSAAKSKKPDQYVVLQTIMYKAMIPEEREIIHPADDPYAADSRRVTLDHMPQTDRNKLLMRKIVALDVQEEKTTKE